MSRTKRTIIKYYGENSPVVKIVDDSQAKWQKQPISPAKEKRLTPYIKDKGHCWKYDRSGFNHDHANTGFGARTGINNANRSMKKGLRQRYKREIQQELTLITT